MQIDLLLKIAGIGMLVTVIAQILTRTGREDTAMLVQVAGLVMALLMVVDLIAQLFASVKSIFQLY
ncbi:MAG: stage III sporulation protein AC [Clostridia bacterium]|nr:stage III sporulation protein AC [Clostridia bacterium]